MEILELLEEEDFRFSMRGRKAEAAPFFGATAQHTAILAERARWLAEDPGLYMGALNRSLEPLREMVGLAREWGVPVEATGKDPETMCCALASVLEPDFVVLSEADEGGFEAVAGAVCFPSSWSFRSALGKRLSEIHAIVPGLNDTLGDKIQGLLGRLRPGDGWERANWGLSLSPERNQHPARALLRLSDVRELEEAWLRVERQILFKLRVTGAILFGIRLVNVSLEDLQSRPGAVEALGRQLRTMPQAMREYKGLGRNLHLLDRWLG